MLFAYCQLYRKDTTCEIVQFLLTSILSLSHYLSLSFIFPLSLSSPLSPSQMELSDLVKPISEKIQEIQNFRECNRGSSQFNHLSAVSESIPALGWVAVVRRHHSLIHIFFTVFLRMQSRDV